MGKNDKVRLKGHMNVFLKWPLILGIYLLMVAFVILVVNKKAGVIALTGVALYIVIAFILFKYNSPRIMNEMVNFASEYNQIQRQMMHALSVPYLLLDKDGTVLWTNEEMDKVFTKENLMNKKISMLVPEIDIDEVLNSKDTWITEFTLMGRYYRAELKKFEVESAYQKTAIVESISDSNCLVGAYLFDTTEIKSLLKAQEEERMVVANVDVDNYDEAMEGIDEVKRSLITAMIDRVVTRYFVKYDGVIKKLEKDKYLVIFKCKYLEDLKADKFSVLEEVKSVKLGSHMAITISIGMGYGEASYIKNFEYARMAMDMALGRGGDQVVIKNDNGMDYFGGKTKTVEKQTRVKARVKALALREIIMSKDNVLIMGHKIGDADSFGSSIGIYRCIKSLNKTARIVINEVTNSMQPMYERFTVENGYEADLFVNTEQALALVNPNTVVIVVDVNRPSYTDCPQLLEVVNNIVVLDHHRRSQETIDNAMLSYIEPFASSASEMISEILQYINDEVVLTQEEVDALYAGIMIDTNNFTNRTGVRTFEAAAYLRRKGADVTRVRMMLRDEMEDYKAKAKAIEGAEVFMDEIAITSCEASDLKSPTVVGAQSANELLNIKGIKAAFVLTPYNNLIYVSARSIDSINVQLVTERLGGGGHANIAGAQIPDSTVEEVKQLLKDTLKEMRKQGEI